MLILTDPLWQLNRLLGKMTYMRKSNDLPVISESSVCHRLRVVQEALKIRSVAAFANEIGVDTSVLNNIISPFGRKGKPSFDTLQKIAARFPRVNMDWLITGKGEPLRDFYEANQPGNSIKSEASRSTLQANSGMQQLVNIPEVLSELRVCQAEKENLERILALKDEIIEILRKQKQD